MFEEFGLADAGAAADVQVALAGRWRQDDGPLGADDIAKLERITEHIGFLPQLTFYLYDFLQRLKRHNRPVGMVSNCNQGAV